ncbi:hypothetical protein PBI_BALOO_53 [Mycobacterium phage Baloo]|uniref:Uncharacterized protein n=2 Tax=Pipefishvirus athena TaxID=1982916 RepID=X2KSE9_9CAUD|nr:hypothetical protein AUDREY_53 [Mycobacterium phage Audrey]AVJ49058.1 hypothetical protein PBI_BALOO_53 [Mycobacterium phage Baloo]
MVPAWVLGTVAVLSPTAAVIATIIIERFSVSPSSKVLDGLMDEARRLSRTKYVHADLQCSEYGWSCIIRDTEPFPVDPDLYGSDADPSPKCYPGLVITAGYGRTLIDAVQAANAALKPRN